MYSGANRLAFMGMGLLWCVGLLGCGSYATPGRGADMEALGVSEDVRKSLTNEGIQGNLDRRPLAKFPATVAVARIQSPNYRSRTAEGYGSGSYSVVITRDIEEPEQMERLGKLPSVAGIAPINRLVLPSHFNSDLELRHAAAKMQADMLLVYTFDTSFHTNDFAKPLSLVTLGLSPNKKTYVVSTASAALLDTRNGFIYGVAEATDKETGLTNVWMTDSALDSARRKAERDAFEKLVGEMEKMWGGVVKQHAPAVGVVGGG